MRKNMWNFEEEDRFSLPSTHNRLYTHYKKPKKRTSPLSSFLIKTLISGVLFLFVWGIVNIDNSFFNRIEKYVKMGLETNYDFKDITSSFGTLKVLKKSVSHSVIDVLSKVSGKEESSLLPVTNESEGSNTRLGERLTSQQSQSFPDKEQRASTQTANTSSNEMKNAASQIKETKETLSTTASQREASASPNTELESAMIYPVEGGKVSSEFGMRVHPVFNDKRFHYGIDFAAPEGTPVHCPKDGLVTEVGESKTYGKTVKIYHGDGLYSFYGHLQKVLVHKDQLIRTGYIFATVGNSGLSTGPHLHFEVIKNGEQIDPLTVLKAS